jgi:hypothetical protein
VPPSFRLRRHWLAAAAVFASVVALAGVALFAAGSAAPAPSPSPASTAGEPLAFASGAGATPSELVVPGTLYQSPSPGDTPGPTFPPLDLFVTPSPAPARGALPTDPSDRRDPRRPLPVQSMDWLTLKAAGRIAIVDRGVAVLPARSDPLLDQSSGLPLPDKRTLDLGWTRWVVEPFGYGHDAKGNYYSNLNYWNLCGDGAMTVALWYWQQLTGHPDVTGTAGYFLDPYGAEAVPWPANGPNVPASKGALVGTYWSGSDAVSGFTAHGRGFVMYMSMSARPATWQSSGFAVFAKDGKALYPTLGTPRTNIQAGLNWEVSGHDNASWPEAYYASVIRPDPTLARDLTAAVMLDVGRDGVPVIGAVDTYNLPNWQNGSATPHIRHAVAIVGYDNTSNPPTFTYLDTCGHSCNNRGGNQNGQIHVIAQSQMVLAIKNTVGSGFVW